MDGTLDREEVRTLANALFDAGQEVHVVTGYCPGDGYTIPMKFEKLKRLGVRFTKVHIAEGMNLEEIGYAKARLLEYHNISLMIDDDPIFVGEMVKNSTACILLVV